MQDSATASAWFALAGALGGILLTGLGGVVIAIVNSRHARQLLALEQSEAMMRHRRVERKEAYADFLVATNDAYQLAADLKRQAEDKGEPLDFRQETGPTVARLMRSQLMLALVGSADVRTLSGGYVRSLRALLMSAVEGEWSDDTKEARNQLFKAMIDDMNPPE